MYRRMWRVRWNGLVAKRQTGCADAPFGLGQLIHQRLVATVLKSQNIICSMSRRGGCWDNAAIERFFSTLKTERCARSVYPTREQSRAAAFDYIEVLKRFRKHSTLNYFSPVQFEGAALKGLGKASGKLGEAHTSTLRPALDCRDLAASISISQRRGRRCQMPCMQEHCTFGRTSADTIEILPKARCNVVLLKRRVDLPTPSLQRNGSEVRQLGE